MQEDQLATLYLAATVVNDQLGQPSTPLSPSPKNLDGLRKRLLSGTLAHARVLHVAQLVVSTELWV